MFLFWGVWIIGGLLLIFLIIQGGVWVMMLLCTFAREIVDSLRIGSIRRPNGLIVLFFCSNCCLYFLWKMQSYAGLDEHDFSLMQYWRANFSLLSCRGASCALVNRVSTGSTPLHLGIVAIEKESSGHPRLRSLTLLAFTYIYIYINI